MTLEKHLQDANRAYATASMADLHRKSYAKHLARRARNVAIAVAVGYSIYATVNTVNALGNSFANWAYQAHNSITPRQ